MKLPGMLYGVALRAKYPRALVKKIDISAARAFPGVEVVLTAKTFLGTYAGSYRSRLPVMIAEAKKLATWATRLLCWRRLRRR